MSVNTTDPMIGRVIDGRYQVRSRIARGGMATVYLATDLRLERRVAVKIMHGHLADDSQFTLRFIQEARSAARLSHPNVVNVFDQGQDAESAYLVMEYLPGITLRDLLHDYGALTPEQTIDITEAVLSGLGAAHKAGIVHRDLKPENVLLADDGRIKIGDFGLARAVSANTATGAALLGTIAYLSPELVTRGVADTRSDIYAVGIMMYEMLTGEQPYKGEQPMQIAYQHANDSVPTPSSKNPRVPAELDELVLWATARDPEDRPRDARMLLDQVRETESQLQTALPTTPTTAQRTMVLPSTAARANAADAQTQVLGSRPAPALAAPALSDSTAKLATSARRRRGRGWIAVLIVVLLVAAAGGTGWWFGVGPGANVGVADVSGLTPSDATAKLTAQGLVVSPSNGTAYSLTAAAGQVAGTSPRVGAVLAKGQSVQLLISQGAQPKPLPKLVGIPEADARGLVHSEWTLKAVTRQFDAAAKGTVIQALDGSGASLDKQATYPQKQPITLVVSAGPLPSVAGSSVDDATTTLTNAGLVVGSTPITQTSTTVAKDDVIGIVTKKADGTAIVITPGSSVTLIVSTGPPPVTIPAGLVGESWATVKATLKKLGLVPSYNQLADVDPAAFTVSKINPGSGETVPVGSTVKVNFSGF